MKGKNINKFLSIVIALTMIIIPLLNTDNVYAGDSGTLQVFYKNLVDSVAAAAGSEDWELIITDAQGEFTISKDDPMTHNRIYEDKIHVKIVIGSAIINGSGYTKQASNLVKFTISNNEFEFSVPANTSPTVHFRDIVLYLTFDEPEVNISLEKVGTWIDKNGNGFTDVGEEIEYEFTITNEGEEELKDVKLVDDKLDINEVVIASLEPISTTTGSGIYVHNFTYKITEEDITLGSLVNIATVSGEADGRTVKYTDSDTIEIIRPEPEPWEGNIRVYKEVAEEGNEAPILEGFLIEVWQDDEMVDSGETDENGQVVFTGLEEGTYTIKENLGDQADEYDVEIENDGEIVLTEENENDDYFDITVTNTKKTEDDPNPDPWEGNIRVNKVVEDEENEDPDLSGFLIEVWQDDEMVDSGETDENGEVVFTGLEAGTYTIVENLGDQADEYNVEIENDGEIVLTEENENDDYFDITVTNTKKTEVIDYELVITKSADVDEYDAVGDEINYTIKVKNTGNTRLTGVEVTDSLIDNLIGSEDYEDGILEPGEEWTFTGTYKIVQADINGGSVLNTAKADSNETDEVTDSVTVDYDKPSPPSENRRYRMTIDKKADVKEYSQAGDVIVYTITLRNTGNTALSDVEVSDTMLKNLTGPEGDDNDNNRLDVNETWVYEGSYTVTEEDMQKKSLTNTAKTESGQTNPVEGSVTVNKTEEEVEILDEETALGVPEVIIEEPEVPQATLPDTGAFMNTSILAAIGSAFVLSGIGLGRKKRK